MKRNSKTHLEHPNKSREFYFGEVRKISPTYKSHRIPVPDEVIKLAYDLKELIEFFKLNFHQCNAIISRKFGEGVGEQSFFHHFLDPIYGPGFNPRDKTMRKYRYLQDFLKEMKKRLAIESKKSMIEAYQESKPPAPLSEYE